MSRARREVRVGRATRAGDAERLRSRPGVGRASHCGLPVPVCSVEPLALAASASPTPQLLPPQSVRMSNRVPPRVDGSERMGRVGAPVVSQLPASANPNLMNLLLEVPYKRGVHTASVNQRYLNHEPTFDAAFELMPARADFGLLQAGCVYRFALKLVNVSNLTQGFNVKTRTGASAPSTSSRSWATASRRPASRTRWSSTTSGGGSSRATASRRAPPAEETLRARRGVGPVDRSPPESR